ncbi:MAG TPA: APC family permease [Thermoleophilaceae bacterium]|jgi:amino acid transporter
MEATTAGQSAQPIEGGFTRKASGLVREFSQLDAWIYNVLALNLVVLIAFNYVAVSVTFPQASLWLSVVICGVLCTFEAIVYAFFMAIMPRSGGDYVFQSRVLGGGIATVFVFTAIVLSQTVLVALTAYLGATLVLSPFFVLLGAQYNWSWLIDAGNWIAKPTGIFVISAVYVVWCAWINIMGLRLYALVQRWVFWIGMACVAIVLVMLLATSHNDFVNNLNSFMSKNYHVQNAYQTTLKNGGDTNTNFSLWATMLAAVYASLFLAFPHWGVMQGGEIKRANSLRGNLWSIAGAEVFSFVVIAIFAALITTKVGSHFLYASGNLFYTADPKNVLPVAPFFGFFVALASGSAIFIWIAFIMFFCWYIMLAPNAPLGATRIMLAMANDKVLPDWFGRVNARSHTPVNSILVFSAICVGVCALYAYATWFVPLTVALVIPSLTAFGVTMVAAILFPKRRSGLYKATPGDKHRLFGIPIMSICAVVFLAFVIFIDYECLTNDTLAINTTKGLVFVGGMYAASFALYFGSKYYRKRKEHFDLGVVYQELPAE